jgi:hypothetical protein
MKKYLLILVLLVSCSATVDRPTDYFSTTWSGTAMSQGITFTALNNLYSTITTSAYYPLCTYPASVPSNSLQLVTKATWESNYCPSTRTGTLYLIPTLTSTRVLIKSDFGFYSSVKTTTGISDCAGTGSVFFLYINADFTKAYTNAAQTTLYNGGGNKFIFYDLYISTNYVYAVIDASGNITTWTASTC